jgi:hypothetical protein
LSSNDTFIRPCGGTELVIELDRLPCESCFDQLSHWGLPSEGKKLKCQKCGNWLSTIRIDKDAFTSDDSRWKTPVAYTFFKHTYGTLDEAKRHFKAVGPRRYTDDNEIELIPHVWAENSSAYIVVMYPLSWFAPGTVKARWEQFGMTIFAGDLRDEYERQTPTHEELAETADMLGGI